MAYILFYLSFCYANKHKGTHEEQKLLTLCDKEALKATQGNNNSFSISKQ